LSVTLGIFPGVPLRALDTVVVSLPGLQTTAPITRGPLAMAPGIGSFDYVVPGAFGVAVLGILLFAALATARRGTVARQVPTWGCGGELTARTEYTATAFSKPLLMIFKAVYRPRREVDSLAEVSPYFPHEVRYRAEVEPTFERYIYRPLLRGVIRGAGAMRVLQAGSLHTYLAYVLVLAVVLLIWLGGAT
jgi:hydrogenase-4 component B